MCYCFKFSFKQIHTHKYIYIYTVYFSSFPNSLCSLLEMSAYPGNKKAINHLWRNLLCLRSTKTQCKATHKSKNNKKQNWLQFKSKLALKTSFTYYIINDAKKAVRRVTTFRTHGGGSFAHTVVWVKYSPSSRPVSCLHHGLRQL